MPLTKRRAHMLVKKDAYDRQARCKAKGSKHDHCTCRWRLDVCGGHWCMHVTSSGAVHPVALSSMHAKLTNLPVLRLSSQTHSTHAAPLLVWHALHLCQQCRQHLDRLVPAGQLLGMPCLHSL